MSKKLKLLLYCTKTKGVLRKLDNYFLDEHNDNYYWKKGQTIPYNVNGKIVAECDFEVEEITYELYGDLDWQHDYLPTTNTMGVCSLENASCLDRTEIENYLRGKNGYAIHIKNLHIFDKPKELSVYYNLAQNGNPLLAKTMQEVGIWEIYDPPVNGPEVEHFVGKFFIPVSSQEMCRIANGEQTALVRRRVLKEMLE